MQQTVDVMMDVDVDSVMVILLFGLSSFYAAVATAILALAIMAVVATIAVYGSSFFSSSVAVDAETITAVSNFS